MSTPPVSPLPPPLPPKESDRDLSLPDDSGCMPLILSGIVIGLVLFFLILGAYILGIKGFLLALGLLVLLMAAVLFALWQLASVSVLFTFLELGHIKAIDRGKGNLIKVIANLLDHHPEKFRVVNGAPRKNFLEKNFGLYYIGLPPATTHILEFVHERLNRDITPTTTPDKWVTRDKAPKKSDYLLWEVPHAYPVFDIEFKDQFSGEVLFECRSRSEDIYTMLYIRQGQFIDFTAQYVEAAVQEILRQYNGATFQDIPKTDGSTLIKEIIDNINRSLPEAVGMEMVGGFISRVNIKQQAILAAEKEAEMKGNAEIKAAERNAKKAEHEKKRIEILAEAEKNRLETEAAGQTAVMIKALEEIDKRYPNLDSDEKVRRATELAIATKMSSKDSPVSVIGAGVSVGVNPERKNK